MTNLCTVLIRFMGQLDPWFFRMLYVKVQLKFGIRIDEAACRRPWDLYNIIAAASGPTSADLFVNAFKNWIKNLCGCFITYEEAKSLLSDKSVSERFTCVEGNDNYSCIG